MNHYSTQIADVGAGQITFAPFYSLFKFLVGQQGKFLFSLVGLKGKGYSRNLNLPGGFTLFFPVFTFFSGIFVPCQPFRQKW